MSGSSNESVYRQTRPLEEGDQSPHRLEQLVEFLKFEPHLADLARYLVTELHSELNVSWVHFSCLQPDAQLCDVGYFGSSPEIAEEFQLFSLWQATSQAEAARFNRAGIAKALTSQGHAFQECHELTQSATARVSFPLSTATRIYGSVTFGFEGLALIHYGKIRELTLVSDLISVYVTNHKSVSALEGSSMLTDFASDTSEEVSPGREEGQGAAKRSRELTPRNLAILRLLSMGLTYEQIASRIGYSHSTVRMDLMHIYRSFGVKTRDEAVEVAKARGISLSVSPDTRARLELRKTTVGSSVKQDQLLLL